MERAGDLCNIAIFERAELMNTRTNGKFRNLPSDEQRRYLMVSRQMTLFARDHAVPITFAPVLRTFPISTGRKNGGTVTLPLSLGKIDGASGCVLRLDSSFFLVTAEHVLAEYEHRVSQGEALNWQVGALPPFDPLPRVAWRGSSSRKAKDIVFVSLSEQEANEIGGGRSYITSGPTRWPPRAPEVGKTVLIAGFPNELRVVDGLFCVQRESTGATIKAGSLSAMLQVTTVGEGYFKCGFEYAELLDFGGQSLPLSQLSANIGGLSGGPVFAVENINYPFLGLVKQRFGALEDADVIVVEALDDLPSKFI